MAPIGSSAVSYTHLATGGRLTARIKEIGSRPGGRLPDDAPILTMIRAIDAHFGIRSHLDCASTDANIPMSLGIPAIKIGSGGTGGRQHSLEEWIDVEKEASVRGMAAGLATVLAVAGMA